MTDIDVVSTIRDPMFERVREELQQANRIVAFLGAGISAESGVPTFRGPDGAYSSTEVRKWVDSNTLKTDRVGMMRWYQKQRDALRRIWPNEAHYALAQLGLRRDLVVATQNVDGLMRQAAIHEGLYDLETYRLHGSLDEIECMSCRRVTSAVDVDFTSAKPCAFCGGPMRPAVTMFGENLRRGIIEDAGQAVMGADVCLVIGTSGLVYPAAELPSLARESGATLIELNLEQTALTSQMDLSLRGSAAETLPALLAGWH